MEVPPEALREHTASRLPSYRFLDIKTTLPVVAVSPTSRAAMHGHDRDQVTRQALQPSNEPASPSSNLTKPSSAKDTVHSRTHSASTISTPQKRDLPLKARPQTLPYPSFATALESIQAAPTSNVFTPRAQKARNVPPGRNTRGLEEFGKGPPRAMITQRSYKAENSSSSTTDWVAQQQSISTGDGDEEHAPPLPAQPSRPVTDSAPGRPLIKPIRGFKPSTRKSVEMSSRRISMDPDATLRALEGYDNSPRNNNSHHTEQDEHNSDDSDLFLRAAKEEELARQASNPDGDGLSRSDSRRVRSHLSFHVQTPICLPSASKIPKACERVFFLQRPTLFFFGSQLRLKPCGSCGFLSSH